MEPLAQVLPKRHAVLDTAQLAAFFSIGWLVLPGMFAPREIERLARRAERLPGAGKDSRFSARARFTPASRTAPKPHAGR